MDFDTAVQRRQAAVSIRDSAQKEIDDLTPEIATALILENTKTKKTGDGAWSVAMVESGGRESLSKEKLLEAGVSVQQIQQATVKGPSTTSVRVTRAKA